MSLTACMVHDITLSVLYFRFGDITLVQALPERLKLISEISDYDNGFITIQTNYGEEYIDLMELMEHSGFSDKYIDRAAQLIEQISLADIVFGTCRTSWV